MTLADYIAKISGQKPEVIDGEPKAMPERAIWIGVQPVVKSLFPKTDFDFEQAEETLIVANEKHLVIAGRDRWNPAHMEAKGRLAMKTGVQQEYGTANAVYSFIQEQLDVRWLWPEEEDVITRDSIAIALNPLHPLADGEAVAAGFKKQIPISSVCGPQFGSLATTTAAPVPQPRGAGDRSMGHHWVSMRYSSGDRANRSRCGEANAGRSACGSVAPGRLEL